MTFALGPAHVAAARLRAPQRPAAPGPRHPVAERRAVRHVAQPVLRQRRAEQRAQPRRQLHGRARPRVRRAAGSCATRSVSRTTTGSTRTCTPGSAVSAANTLTISAYNNANQRTNYFNQTDLIKSFDTGGITHTFLAGVELGYQDSANQRLDGVFGTNTLANLPNVPAVGPVRDRHALRRQSERQQCEERRDRRTSRRLTSRTRSPSPTRSSSSRACATTASRSTSTTSAPSSPPIDLGPHRHRREPARRARSSRRTRGRRTTSATATRSCPRASSSASRRRPPTSRRRRRATTRSARASTSLRNLTLTAAIFRLDRDDVRAADPANPGFFVKTGQQRTNGVEIGLQGEVTRELARLRRLHLPRQPRAQALQLGHGRDGVHAHSRPATTSASRRRTRSRCGIASRCRRASAPGSASSTRTTTTRRSTTR